MLTQEELKQHLSYDPETGIFTWLTHIKPRKIGTRAGSDRKGYEVICFSHYKTYNSSHLAWCYMTGEWPTMYVDHIDRDKKNNRWNNLRLATKSQNIVNRTTKVVPASGYKGVSRLPGNRWRAKLYTKDISWTDTFPSAEEAYAAYCRIGKEIHGEFFVP